MVGLVTGPISGLDRFAPDLHPAVLGRVRGWTDVPGLRGLLDSLEAQQRPRRFMDLWAEALVADRLVQHGCDLDTEVVTPSGRTCDFRVRRGGQEWYLHVKRLHEDESGMRRLAVSPRLRVLERIERPFIVRIRWRESLDDEEMQELVVRASTFLQMARVGDELTVRDDSGLELGAVRVVSPCEGRHVSLAIGLPEGFIDETLRIRRLLERAYRQFMPRRENVVLVIGTRPDEAADFQAALLGSPEERWDAHPPQGHRVAWGRAPDGFWSGGSRPDSCVAGWCRVRPGVERLLVDTYFRKDPAPADSLRRDVVDLFGGDHQDSIDDPHRN